MPCDSITPLGAPVLPEVNRIDASAFRSGGAGGVFGVAAQNEWTRELGEIELDEFRMRVAERRAEALVNRARAQRGRGLGDLADRRELFGRNQLVERHRNRAGA